VLAVEQKLMKLVPKEEWTDTHHRLVFFGRYHCKAQRPQCDVCPLLDVCNYGKKRMKTGGDSKPKSRTPNRGTPTDGPPNGRTRNGSTGKRMGSQ
jgi:endonuclease-3